MDYQVVIFSFSIFAGTLLGWIRFKWIEPAYFPFIICLSVASLNEIISLLMTGYNRNTSVNNNTYVLMEALLISWQFRRWGLFSGQLYAYYIIIVLLAGTWTIENFLIHDIFRISFHFRILYSFAIVLMSIHMSNNLIFTYRHGILKSPVFLVCIGFIVYFTYKILVEAFWFYGLNATKDFRVNVYTLLTWINLIVNLIYAVAILWIPRKPRHTMLY